MYNLIKKISKKLSDNFLNSIVIINLKKDLF
jgi:hypothetical protein